MKAYASVVIDKAFVVRDPKIIDGNMGLFVAMASRKLADHCLVDDECVEGWSGGRMWANGGGAVANGMP